MREDWLIDMRVSFQKCLTKDVTQTTEVSSVSYSVNKKSPPKPGAQGVLGDAFIARRRPFQLTIFSSSPNS